LGSCQIEARVARDGNGAQDDPQARSRSGADVVRVGGIYGWLTARRSLGLPGKLLLLTSIFVMLAEILIFVPSLANFRVNWLADRINAAHLAALASDAVPGGTVPASLRIELLSTAQVRGIAVRRMGQRRMVLPPDEDLKIDATHDMRPMASGLFDGIAARVQLIFDAMAAFTMPPTWTMRVLGQPNALRQGDLASPFAYAPDDFVEILLPGAPLRDAMTRFGLNILGLSLIISGITAALVYFALSGLLVRPMMRLASNMTRFREMPEDASRIIVPSNRTDEIGVTERELARMQSELVHLLQQRNRLAQLGLAVSKVNHDLRNMLATAQLMSDRLAALPDPAVQRFAPKLIASLDRAISFCNDTLTYGRAEEAGPRRTRFPLRLLADEVGEGLGLPHERMTWSLKIDRQLEIDADRDHLFRILNNLVRNAVQAIEAGGGQSGVITITAVRENGAVAIRVADNGPGVPEKALANLFQAFKGGARKGGTGLGLAIAAELITAHGGQLRHEAGQPGAIFVFEIADRAAGN
jgi:signal transduction histidine kinase